MNTSSQHNQLLIITGIIVVVIGMYMYLSPARTQPQAAAEFGTPAMYDGSPVLPGQSSFLVDNSNSINDIFGSLADNNSSDAPSSFALNDPLSSAQEEEFDDVIQHIRQLMPGLTPEEREMVEVILPKFQQLVETHDRNIDLAAQTLEELLDYLTRKS